MENLPGVLSVKNEIKVVRSLLERGVDGIVLIGAEHDAVGALRRPGVADGVVHVAARVVGDGARQVAVEEHAMHQPPIVARERLQPLPRGHVVGPFSHVDVHAHPEVGGEAGRAGQRVVGAREGGVHAHHAASAGALAALPMA